MESTRRRLLLARLLLGLTIGGTVVGVVFLVLDAARTDTPISEAIASADIPFTLTFAVFPFVGYVIAKRQPQNSLGWLLLGIGGALGIGAIVDSYAIYAVHGGVGGRDAGAVAAAINETWWVPMVPPIATFLLLLFPDGHLPSPRWRWFAWTLGVGLGLIWLMILILPGKMTESPFPNMRNPLGIEALRPIVDAALVLLVLLPIGIIGSVASLVLRFRRSTGVERLQLRWLVSAATVMGILFVSASRTWARCHSC
jgi:two-component system NarL family sensor kinase